MTQYGTEAMTKLKKARSSGQQALIFATMALALVACGCKKSPREIAEENAVKRHQKEAAQHPMMSAAQWSNYIKTPEGRKFMIAASALNFAKSSKTNGQLPGISKDTKGRFIVQKSPWDMTPDGGSSVQVIFSTPDHPAQIDYYIVGRVSSNSSWEFKKAWRADQSGNVIEEFPVQ